MSSSRYTDKNSVIDIDVIPCVNVLEAMFSLDPPPCDKCDHRVECQTENKACFNFYLYTVKDECTGKNKSKAASRCWPGEEQKPSKSWYRDIFTDPARKDPDPKRVC